MHLVKTHLDSYFSVTYSSIYESPAEGFEGENFLNMVCKFESKISPYEIRDILKSIEKEMGRTLNQKGMSNRVIDLDLILYGNLVIKDAELEQVAESSWHSNFTAGFIITISAPRAILFYVSLLPNFIDLTKARLPDVLLLMLVAIVAVGGAKLPYALLAYRSSLFLQEEKPKRVMNLLAGIVMMLIGIIVALKA